MWQMQGFFTLQRVRHSPLPSPGQTTGHKKRQRRKARKKQKSQMRHGVENVKRKNNRVWARRHDEETQAENGQVPPGFLAFLGGLGGLGRWDGRDERYVPTSPDHGPGDALCCPPRALQWSLASTEKWIVHNLRGSALRDCQSAILHGRLLFCSSSSSGEHWKLGAQAKVSIHSSLFLPSCLPRETSSSLLLFCSLRVLDAIDNDADDTSTSPPSLVPAVKPSGIFVSFVSAPVCDLPPVPPSILPIVSVPLRSLALRLATLHLSSRLFSEQALCRSSGSCTWKRVDLVFLHHLGTYFLSGHV